MNIYSRPDTGKIALIVFICILLAVCLLCVAKVKAERAGDTVTLYGTYRSATGVAKRPTTARAYVWLNGAIVDSSKTLAGGGITNIRGHLYWTYAIPSAATNKSRYFFSVSATDGTTADWFSCIPATVILENAIVDSLAPAAVVDLYHQEASTTFTTIDSTDGGGCYVAGQPVTGAFVFAHTDQYNPIGTNIGFGTSRIGDYTVTIPVSPTLADTCYVSIWYQNTWLEASTRVILP